MPRVGILALLLAFTATSYAAGQFVPPVLKGVENDGKAWQARPVPFPDVREAWTLVRSKHFTFISSMSDKRTREVAEDLETLAAALAQLNPRFKADAPVSTRVILFNRHREAQPYFNLLLQRDDASVSGVYAGQKSGGAMIMDVSFGARSDRTPFHELVHDLIANSGAHPPLWLSEGIADYFSNAEIHDRTIRAGVPIAVHVERLRRRDLIPLPQLFTIVRESDAYNLPAGQRAFYAESWAAVDWLLREAGEHQETFYAFLSDVERGTPVESALEARYGKTLTDMQRALDAYGRFERPHFAMKIPVPNVDTATTARRLDRADILYELGTFLATMEVTRGEAERHFRAALESNPRHARAIAAIGGLRASDARYDEAAKSFEQAVAADPGDATIQLAYAEALLQTQIGPLAEANEVRAEEEPRFRKARELAHKAIALNTEEPGRAYGDLGTTYIVEKDSNLAPGIGALEKARTLVPGRLDYAMHLFALYRRTGDRAKADPLFALLDSARDPHVSYAARAVMMRVELGRVNALVKDNKLGQAVAAMRDLAAATEDADARKDLERQAAEIERVAEQNRQIEIYNKAIVQVNSGDYRAARKTIDALLAEATDAGVIRDAKKLQKQLSARK